METQLVLLLALRTQLQIVLVLAKSVQPCGVALRLYLCPTIVLNNFGSIVMVSGFDGSVAATWGTGTLPCVFSDAESGQDFSFNLHGMRHYDGERTLTSFGFKYSSRMVSLLWLTMLMIYGCLRLARNMQFVLLSAMYGLMGHGQGEGRQEGEKRRTKPLLLPRGGGFILASARSTLAFSHDDDYNLFSII